MSDEFFGFGDIVSSYINELIKYHKFHTVLRSEDLMRFILSGVWYLDPLNRFVFNMGLITLATRHYVRKLCVVGRRIDMRCVNEKAEKVLDLSVDEQAMILSKFSYLCNLLYLFSWNAREIYRQGYKWLLTQGRQEISYQFHGYIPTRRPSLPKVFGTGGEEGGGE